MSIMATFSGDVQYSQIGTFTNPCLFGWFEFVDPGRYLDQLIVSALSCGAMDSDAWHVGMPAA